MEAAGELDEKGVKLIKKTEEELAVFLDAVREIMSLAFEAFRENDVKKAVLVEPLEEVIDDINTCVKANHIRRLRNGECTILQGFILSDISTDLERVADHCSNIAVSVIEISRDGFDVHGYLENLRSGKDPAFLKMAAQFRKKYDLREL
jgi:phosphate:Na+ symporter